MRQFFERHTLPVIAAIYVKWRIWSFLVTRGIFADRRFAKYAQFRGFLHFAALQILDIQCFYA